MKSTLARERRTTKSPQQSVAVSNSWSLAQAYDDSSGGDEGDRRQCRPLATPTLFFSCVWEPMSARLKLPRTYSAVPHYKYQVRTEERVSSVGRGKIQDSWTPGQKYKSRPDRQSVPSRSLQNDEVRCSGRCFARLLDARSSLHRHAKSDCYCVQAKCHHGDVLSTLQRREGRCARRASALCSAERYSRVVGCPSLTRSLMGRSMARAPKPRRRRARRRKSRADARALRRRCPSLRSAAMSRQGLSTWRGRPATRKNF